MYMLSACDEDDKDNNEDDDDDNNVRMALCYSTKCPS